MNPEVGSAFAVAGVVAVTIGGAMMYAQNQRRLQTGDVWQLLKGHHYRVVVQVQVPQPQASFIPAGGVTAPATWENLVATGNSQNQWWSYEFDYVGESGSFPAAQFLGNLNPANTGLVTLNVQDMGVMKNPPAGAVA